MVARGEQGGHGVGGFIASCQKHLRSDRKQCMQKFLRDPVIENTCDLVMVETQLKATNLLFAQQMQLSDDMEVDTVLDILKESVRADIEATTAAAAAWCRNPMSANECGHGDKLRTLLTAQAILDGILDGMAVGAEHSG